MAKSARELFEEAMRLDPKERATLMRLLVDTLDAESEEGADEAWRAEIKRRIAELDSGQVQAALDRPGPCGGFLGRVESAAVPALNGFSGGQVPSCCRAGGGIHV